MLNFIIISNQCNNLHDLTDLFPFFNCSELHSSHYPMKYQQNSSVSLKFIFAYRVVRGMKRKYDKVDLTGDSFKARRSPQKIPKNTMKSSLTNTPAYVSKQSTDKIDPNHLFQKVCCPNCRYIFKIIKNAEVLFPQPPKKIDTRQTSVQTDQIQSKELRTLSKMREELSRMERQESSIFKVGLIKHNNISKSQIIKEPQHLKESTYKFPDSSNITKKNPRRISNATPDLKSQSSFNQFSRTNTKNDHHHENNKAEAKVASQNMEKLFYEQYEKAWREVRQQVKRDLLPLPALLESELRNSKTIDELTSFYINLPNAIEIPAYCKMLIRDYQSEGSKPQEKYDLGLQ